MITERAENYIKYVSSKTGIPAIDLYQVFRGSPENGGGTWLHPKLAIPFATWLSVEFEYEVSEWVQAWMAGYRVEQQQSSAIAFLVSSVTREYRPWEVHFTPDWIREAERLTGWSWSWGCMGGFINKSVYNVLPIEMQARLDEVNPAINGKRARKKFQHVTAAVDEQVIKQLIAETLGMMRGSSSEQSYWRSHCNAYGNGVQLTLVLGGCDE